MRMVAELEQWIYRNRHSLEPFLYRVLSLFTTWYAIEVLLLLFYRRGLILSFQFAKDVLAEPYFVAIAVYSYETFVHPKNRWGHAFAWAWAIALTSTGVITIVRPETFVSIDRAFLVLKVALVVLSLWVTKKILRVLRHKDEQPGNPV